MDNIDLPEIPATVRCDACGDVATVVRQETRHGEQLVIVRMQDGLFISIRCAKCGLRQQSVDTISN